MDETLAQWLLLREPPDAGARSSTVTRALVDAVAGRDSVRVLDLGTGTGANVRYLIPHLPRRQQWLIADRDAALLALIPDRMSASAPFGSTIGWPIGTTVRALSLRHCQAVTSIDASVGP